MLHKHSSLWRVREKFLTASMYSTGQVASQINFDLTLLETFLHECVEQYVVSFVRVPDGFTPWGLQNWLTLIVHDGCRAVIVAVRPTRLR